MDKCDFCICKTCAIAYSNGGAEGCGDCDLCKGTPNQKPVNSCYDYYNPKPRNNDKSHKANESQD